jgi:hypothetical protein
VRTPCPVPPIDSDRLHRSQLFCEKGGLHRLRNLPSMLTSPGTSSPRAMSLSSLRKSHPRESPGKHWIHVGATRSQVSTFDFNSAISNGSKSLF